MGETEQLDGPGWTAESGGSDKCEPTHSSPETVIDVLDPKECGGRAAKVMDDDPVYKTPTINLQDEHGSPQSVREEKERRGGKHEAADGTAEREPQVRRGSEYSALITHPKHTKKESGGDRGTSHTKEKKQNEEHNLK